MKRVFVLVVFLSSLLFAQDFIDSDLDGVDDRFDKCPHSLLIDIVDKNGCAIKKLQKNRDDSYYDFSLGFSYLKDNNETIRTKTVSFSYYYKNFSLYLFTAFTKDGMDDSTLEFGYRYNFDHKISFGIYLPTLDVEGNRVDYFLQYKYSFSWRDFDFSFSWRHTFMQDSNTKDIDTLRCSIGYIFNDTLYSSLSYNYETALYKDTNPSHTLSLYLNYTLGEHWYISSEFSFALNKSTFDKAFSFSLGYTF